MATTQIRVLLTHNQKLEDSNPPSQRPHHDRHLGCNVKQMKLLAYPSCALEFFKKTPSKSIACFTKTSSTSARCRCAYVSVKLNRRTVSLYPRVKGTSHTVKHTDRSKLVRIIKEACVPDYQVPSAWLTHAPAPKKRPRHYCQDPGNSFCCHCYVAIGSDQ